MAMKRKNDLPEKVDALAQSKSIEIEKYLKAKLERKRYKHVLSVRDTAVDLARIYEADLEKTNLAALLHDCAKWMNTRQLYEAVADYEIQLDEFEQIHTSLLHAIVGAELAIALFSVTDEEILGAIRSHTKGNRSMTLLDKILYVADFAEPRRTYEEASTVLKLAHQDVDQGVFEVARHKIFNLLEKGVVIHPNTVAVYNGALRKIDES